MLKEFADDKFYFYENGRKFFKWVKNTLGKAEIARNEQFLLFPQCFQKTCTAGTFYPGLVWEGVITRIRIADDKFNFDENGRKFIKLLENTEGKGEIARFDKFLLSPQCFQKTSTADT